MQDEADFFRHRRTAARNGQRMGLDLEGWKNSHDMIRSLRRPGRMAGPVAPRYSKTVTQKASRLVLTAPMKPPHRNRRLFTVAAALGLVALSATLALSALRENISYFRTPSELSAGEAQPGARIRLGGMVEEGSVVYGEDAEMTFRVTDGTSTVAVIYSGSVPDLFREGQGVIADGAWTPEGRLRADRVLAKHDEDYTPVELEYVNNATE